ncbi:MAG TPA: hypothetical protein VKC17_12740 [Sphingomicrobium sp.]|nr:hypothetical protein [Sphingomicrobium sp.]
MCPICLSTLGWIAVGGGAGSGTLAALFVGFKRRKSKEEDHDRSSNRQQ